MKRSIIKRSQKISKRKNRSLSIVSKSKKRSLKKRSGGGKRKANRSVRKVRRNRKTKNMCGCEKQRGGSPNCEYGIVNNTCNEDDHECISNIVDFLMHTETGKKHFLDEASKNAGITNQLESAVDEYYDKYTDKIKSTNSLLCAGETMNFCYLTDCKMRALNYFYLFFKKYAEAELKQFNSNPLNKNSNRTWRDFMKIPEFIA